MIAPAGWIATRAPAKLNLGLAVLGRRDDGYHDLATIFQTVALYDGLALRRAPQTILDGTDSVGAGECNLALVAIERLRARAGAGEGAEIRLTKAIPIAAGVGGASSDAAAALRTGRALLAPALAEPAVAERALGSGSDVPLFLRGGRALGTGRGDVLEALPPLAESWFVIVVPGVSIPRKTATLYASLSAADLGGGEAVFEQAERLRRGRGLDPGLLGNAFERALYGLRPELVELRGVIEHRGPPVVALTGAGPSHYAPMNDPEAASALAARLREELGRRAVVVEAAAVAGLPAVRG